MLSVVILVSNEEQEALAASIQTKLRGILASASAGGGAANVVRVTIRSALVPPEHLLRLVLSISASTSTTATTTPRNSDQNKTLFVTLGSATVTTLYMETYSEFPVLRLNEATTTIAAATAVVDAHAWTIAKFCTLYSSSTMSFKTLRDTIIISSLQASLVHDAQLKSRNYVDRIASCYDSNQQITGDAVVVTAAKRIRGKVRDRWESNDETKTVLALVTTDRQSGFDRQLAVVPYKGAVLNLCSQFWFDATSDILPNHLMAVPHPSVSIVRRCVPFPIEFVVRSYLTGSTSTSIWKNYAAGVRLYCGHGLADGMVRNQKLPQTLLTPTTKEEEHDRLISLADIVKESWMTQDDLDVCSAAALAVFARGQEIAAQRGLILVDTKYEFGKCAETGRILLIDEVHTPDSSRYWLANSYDERMAQNKEPENIDKEFLRLWFADHCDPYKDAELPAAPRDLVIELSRRYIQLYEMITGKDFDVEAQMTADTKTGEAEIGAAIEQYL